jgi:hypothetical protein
VASSKRWTSSAALPTTSATTAGTKHPEYLGFLADALTSLHHLHHTAVHQVGNTWASNLRQNLPNNRRKELVSLLLMMAMIKRF